MGSPPPVMMANLGMWDSLILMVLALVVLGPRRLPELGRQIGKLMYEFRKASNDFKFQMEEELRQSEEADRRKKEEDERQRALAAAAPPSQIAPPAETPIESAESASSLPPTAIGADVSDPAAMAVAAPIPESTIESPMTTSAPESPSVEPPESSSQMPVEPAPAAPFEPAHPRIAPPSSGEKVAAERPGARPAQQDLFAHETGNAPENVAPEAERSEPAAHHG